MTAERRTPPSPTLKLKEITNAATTYSFVNAERDFGWALCTVNDQTGELVITSDWGSWSYMWSPAPSHLGAATLTHFLGSRSGPDYLRGKLLGRRGEMQFSARATTAHFRKLLCAARWKDGKHQNERLLDLYEYGEDETDYREGLEGIRADNHHRLLKRDNERWRLGDPSVERDRYYLTAAGARELWNELGDLESDLGDGSGDAAQTLYVERFGQLDYCEFVTDDPWQETQSVESNEAKILHDTILPALIAACRKHADETPAYVKLREDHEARCRAKAEEEARARGEDAAVSP